MNTRTKPTVPIFFATDDNYAPFLGVALRSMADHVSPRVHYRVHILTSGLKPENERRLRAMSCENIELTVDPITKIPPNLAKKLHVRDYYSIATYYRLFIAGFYPQYKKVLYVDCDVLLRDDIAKLYRTNIGENILGAVTDDFVYGVRDFTDYGETVLGMAHGKYINAGILIMNLEAYRRHHIESRFIRMLGQVQYRVAQDQDYLNVLCRDRIHYLPYSWNRTASDDYAPKKCKSAALVHFKLAYKPWHYDGVLFGDEFWECAGRTEFFCDIKNAKAAFTEKDAQHDRQALINLQDLAVHETEAYIMTHMPRTADGEDYKSMALGVRA